MLEYRPAPMMKKPQRIIMLQKRHLAFCAGVLQRSLLGVRWNQKMPETPYVNQDAKMAEMTPRRSLKKGMTSAMTKARAQMTRQMPIQVAHPTKECEVMWIECWPLRRKLQT